MELLEVLEEGLRVKDGLLTWIEPFEAIGREQEHSRRKVREAFPDYPWSDRAEVRLTPEQMYGNRADEVWEDMASRKHKPIEETRTPWSDDPPGT